MSEQQTRQLNPSETLAVTMICQLWPERKTTDQEIELFQSVVVRYPEELVKAAFKNHKMNHRAKSPNLAAFRSTINAMAENFRGQTAATGAQAEANARAAQYAEWRREAEADDEVTRAWINSISDAEIVRIAERAIRENSPMLIGIFGDASADARMVQKKIKGVPPIVPSRIRDNFFARGMLRAFADMQSEAA